LRGSAYLAEEVIRVWMTLAGVLKHLAVLKYLQICQKHRSFAMHFFSVKVGPRWFWFAR
jgi:hypothetical protein